MCRSLSTLGLATITGFALRLRIYEAFGLTRADVTRLTLYNEATFYVGLATTFAFVFLFADVPNMVAIGVALPSPKLIGLIAAGLAVAYVGLSLGRTRPWRIRSFELPAVRGGLLAGQLILPIIDMSLGVGIVWVCLPEVAGLGYFETATACLLAGLAGSISQVPGGLGVFETVVLQFVPPEAHGAALAGLLVRRVITNLVPLAVGTVVLVGFEVATRPGSAIPLGWRRQTVATALAATAFASGVCSWSRPRSAPAVPSRRWACSGRPSCSPTASAPSWSRAASTSAACSRGGSRSSASSCARRSRAPAHRDCVGDQRPSRVLAADHHAFPISR